MLLLDTHAFYWFICDASKLSDKARHLIETEESVFVSICSFWEMSIKSSLGKLTLPASITELMETCAEYDITILPISAAHLERLNTLPWVHRDPFDRMLICQAQEEDLALVTVDANIAKYSVKTVW